MIRNLVILLWFFAWNNANAQQEDDSIYRKIDTDYKIDRYTGGR